MNAVKSAKEIAAQIIAAEGKAVDAEKAARAWGRANKDSDVSESDVEYEITRLQK